MSSSPSPSTVSSVRSNTRAHLTGAWVFAVLWTLISAPLLVMIPQEIDRKPIAAIGFVFPIIGVALLTRAAVLTLRWRRFGPAWFDMAMPAAVGGTCAGTIRIRLERPSPGDRLVVAVKLTSLQRIVRGSGKHRSVRENIVWREEQELPAERILFTPTGAAIPVQFVLPADALETTASKRSEGVFWALAVDASLPGVDLHEDFDVPVSRGVMTDSRRVRKDRPYDVTVTRQDLAAAGIHVRQNEAGVEYHFAAARNPSFAIGLTAFLLIWTGAIWLQVALDAPWFFPLLTGLFELLLLAMVADLWLGTTTITIGRQTITRRYAIAGLGATRGIDATEIVKIDLHISMQTSGRSGTPYYEIRATLRSGRRRSLGGGIRNKAHAEWLAREMRAAIGLPA